MRYRLNIIMHNQPPHAIRATVLIFEQFEQLPKELTPPACYYEPTRVDRRSWPHQRTQNILLVRYDIFVALCWSCGRRHQRLFHNTIPPLFENFSTSSSIIFFPGQKWIPSRTVHELMTPLALIFRRWNQCWHNYYINIYIIISVNF